LLRVHYNSSLLEFVEPDWVNPTGADVVYSTPAAEDFHDFDNDPATDAYLLVGWASFGLAWPGAADLPDLMRLRFKAVAGGEARVRITAAETSPAHALDAVDTVVNISGAAPAYPSVTDAFGKESDASGYVYTGDQMGYLY